MKPLRGKRVGSAQSARRIQPGGRGRPCRAGGSPPSRRPLAGRWVPGGDRRPDGSGPRRAHFRRSGAPRPAPGRLGRPRTGRWPAALRRAAGVTARRQQLSPHPGAEGEDRRRARLPRRLPAAAPAAAPLAGAGGQAARGPARAGAGPPRPRRDCLPGRTVLSAPRPRRAAGRDRAAPGARGPRRRRPPPRPVLKHGPRSLTRARVRGCRRKPRGAMKVRAGARRPRWDPEASERRAHHRPVSPAPSGRWSVSARARTRKMVNYAWAGRSQRKLWWRSVAVLTCKSVVRPGYRGERLIEPSSSWFPPKFPSG